MRSLHDKHRPGTDSRGSGGASLSRRTYVRGALYALAAVSIWAAWIVVARLGITTSLSPWDIAALRFGVAGLLLLPVLLRKGLAQCRVAVCARRPCGRPLPGRDTGHGRPPGGGRST